MITVVGGVKGGSGKTTIATNLTVMRSNSGSRVLLVDGDEQKSASTWADQRDARGIQTKWTTVSLSGKALYTQVLKMKEDYDDIIIDVGGRETTSLRAAVALADIFIVPFKPRSFDIWTLGDVGSLISEMKTANQKLVSLALINQADPKGTDNHDALNILKECDELKCLTINIGSRKAFSNAAADGLSVTELKTIDKKAIQEIQDLYNEVYTKRSPLVHQA